MKIHTPNAVSASGPTMYDRKGGVPITNLPLFLTVYETTIEDQRGMVVWSALSLKPSNALGTRRLSIQLRCYVYEQSERFVVRCLFAPDDPVYSQYIITVPWASTTVEGYMTIQNGDEVWDASTRISFGYDEVTHVLQLFVQPPIALTHQTIFLNLFI